MKKILAIFLVLFAFSGAVFAQEDEEAFYKAMGLQDDNQMWYEFTIQKYKSTFKFYAFKTDEQRNNRTIQLFKSAGWGMGPRETITEFYNFNAAEKVKMWDNDLKPIMKKEGYKYAFTTYRLTDKDETKIFMNTFYYDKLTDDLYMLKLQR